MKLRFTVTCPTCGGDLAPVSGDALLGDIGRFVRRSRARCKGCGVVCVVTVTLRALPAGTGDEGGS